MQIRIRIRGAKYLEAGGGVKSVAMATKGGTFCSAALIFLVLQYLSG